MAVTIRPGHLTVLVSAPDDGDVGRIQEVFACAGWPLEARATLREALEWIRSHAPRLVISNSELPDGTWRDLVQGLDQLEDPPLLIVFSRLADADLWAEVLSIGCYDLLMSPVAEEEVLRLVPSAWADSRRRRAGRAAGTGQPPAGLE